MSGKDGRAKFVKKAKVRVHYDTASGEKEKALIQQTKAVSLEAGAEHARSIPR